MADIDPHRDFHRAFAALADRLSGRAALSAIPRPRKESGAGI